MTTPPGWRPLQQPRRAVFGTGGSPGLGPTPFMQLARTHALGTVADGFITAALAGSVFFSISPESARWRVALTLLLTIAPFAIVTPLIGPAIDRAKGGRRGMIVAANAGRAVLALLMVSHLKTLLLFPEAFGMLVLKTGAGVAQRAVVPKLVDSPDRLVEANSKLALISALGNMIGVVVGALAGVLFGAAAACALAAVFFAVSALAATRLPPVAVAEVPVTEAERVELASISIAMAGSAMAVLRGVVGFVTLLLAFELRGGKEGVDLRPEGAAAGAAAAMAQRADVVGDPGSPTWHYGVVLLAAGVGGLVGARVAPALRRKVPEEKILVGVLTGTFLAALYALWSGGLSAAMAIALVVGIAAAAGKLAFDSLVQRDAPDANYGRSFARFEARFQLAWVAGAIVPTVVAMPERIGYVFIAFALGFALLSYGFGVRTTRSGAALLSRLWSRASRTAAAGEDPSGPRRAASIDDTIVDGSFLDDHMGPGVDDTLVMEEHHDAPAVAPADAAGAAPAPHPSWKVVRAPRRAGPRRRSDGTGTPDDEPRLFD